VDEQMNVIVLSIEFHQLRFKIAANRFDNFLQPTENGSGKNTPAILRNKN
jgi:hypothetical protein